MNRILFQNFLVYLIRYDRIEFSEAEKILNGKKVLSELN